MRKPVVRALATIGVCLAAAGADRAVAAPVAVGLGGATDYVFRGISQTRGRPDIFGSVDADIGSLGYAGVWASNVNFADGARGEVDLYGGVRPKIGPVTVDLGVIHYAYLDQTSGPHLDYTEIKVSPSMQLGPATFAAAWFHSENFLGRSGSANYVEVNAATSLAATPFSLSAAVGHQQVARLPDYTTWNVGLGYAVNSHLGVDLRYWDTDAHGQGSAYGSRIAFGVKATFP